MLKLKHLFNQPALAEMLLKNWDYDETSLELFQYFRISANAIYPFRQNNQVCYLRFCPVVEKSSERIAAELEFIHYLRDRHYQALEPIPARTGDEWVQKATPWGDYIACAFKRVEGQQLSETRLDDEVVFVYGAALGRLHHLSSQYTPVKAQRRTHLDIMNWIEETFDDQSMGGQPRQELTLLKNYLADLPITPDNYGLIHYDFEPDNVFFDDATKSCHVIDFDDAIYHWFMMDIGLALDALQGEITGDEFPQKKAVFIEGYQGQRAVDPNLLGAMPVFGKFARLYRYARTARSIQEQWDNEPEWMVQLRAKLVRRLRLDAEEFGKPINAV